MTWTTANVFISSTFHDMQAERDYLVRFVFPRLREQLLHRRVHVVDVDLRWGVAGNMDILGACREIIDECHPRFVCILGGRYGSVPEGKECSITETEIQYGVLSRVSEVSETAFFYYRDPAVTDAVVEIGEGEYRDRVGSTNWRKLEALKRSIQDAGFQPRVFQAQWDDRLRRMGDLQSFGELVYKDLARSLSRKFGTDAVTPLDEFESANAAMDAFTDTNRWRFVLGSRSYSLQRIVENIRSDGSQPLIGVTGPSGSGKSSLLAHLGQVLRTEAGTRSIVHFVGIHPGSTDERMILRRLCHELAGDDTTSLLDDTMDVAELRLEFSSRLRLACDQHRVAIVVDAINQLDLPRDARLDWLPRQLPPNARIVISIVDPSDLEPLRDRLGDIDEVSLQNLPRSHREEIVNRFSDRFHKSFEPDQKNRLLGTDASGANYKRDIGTPLYLTAALQELRSLGSPDEVTARIAELPPTTKGLFVWILRRLETDDGFQDASGNPTGDRLVRRFCAFLSASRHGLSQRELTDLVEEGDPRGNVAALLRLIRPYMMHRGELLDFYHEQFRLVASKVTDDDLPRIHARLALHFRSLADPQGDGTWNGNDSRPFLELQFHLARCDVEGLVELLLNPRWLRAMVDRGLVLELLGSFEEAIAQTSSPRRRTLDSVQRAIRISKHVIADDPTQFTSQIVGRLKGVQDSELERFAESALQSDVRASLIPVTASLSSPRSHVSADTGGGSGVAAAASSADGAVIVSAYRSGLIVIHNVALGRDLERIEFTESRPTEICVCSLGSEVLWTTREGDLWLWRAGLRLKPICFHDVNQATRGQEIRSINVADQVSALSIPPSGEFALTGSFRGTVTRWNLSEVHPTWTVAPHQHSIRAISISRDGTLAGICSRGQRDWETMETKDGGTRLTFKGHMDDVECVAISPDGRDAASGSRDGTVLLWETSKASVSIALEGHAAPVTAVTFAPNGRLVASASDDKTIRVTDPRNGGLQVIQRSHHGTARWIGFSPCGTLLTCLGDDGLRTFAVKT